MEFKYGFHDTTYTVNLQAQPDGNFIAQIDGAEYDVEVVQLPSGAMILRINDQPLRAYYAADAQRNHYVAMQHRNIQHYTFAPVETRQTSRRSAAADSQITAQMPGQVIEVAVSAGDIVTQGQTLLVLEAMKMEIRVQAPADATVQAVLVEQGTTVDRGQVLIDLVPTDETTD